MKEITSKDENLTFDGVLMVPQYSEVLPKETDLTSRLTKNITLKIPLISAAMDTVTGDKMAITMALQGGIGVVHKNNSPEEQAEIVQSVKRFESGLIRNPLTLSPQHKISDVVAIREKKHFKTIPITEDGTLDSRVVGMITRNDYLPEKHADNSISKRMTPIDEMMTAKDPLTLAEANQALSDSKQPHLLVLKPDGKLSGMVMRRDLETTNDFPCASRDKNNRLLVAAAVGPAQNMEERVEKLVNAKVDIIVVDTAHGHSKGVIDTIKFIKKNYPKIDVIGGNIASAKAVKDLIEAGADAIKVGIGPGSICTTRIIAGVGVPQLSAIINCAEVANKFDIPIIADGGIKYSGDFAKALAAGASTVMVGSLLAGTTESPGELIYSNGQTYKYYRGMGSMAAMKKGGKERYAQSNVADEKLVPEGIEGKVLLKGSAINELYQLIGGVRSAMGYNGAKNITELQEKAEFVRITNAGLKESHPHDVSILKDAPNYK